MKEYRVREILTINTGKIGLTDKQAKTREHLLKPLKPKGTYEIRKTVTFKVGEIIRLPGVDKVSKSKLEEVKARK